MLESQFCLVEVFLSKLLTENHGGGTAKHDPSGAISQISELQLLPFS